MYIKLKRSKDSDDLSFGLHRSITSCEQKLSINKKVTGKYQARSFLDGVSGFEGHQDNATNGLVSLLTLQGNSDNKVLSHEPGAGVDSAAREAAKTAIEGRSFHVVLEGLYINENQFFSPRKVILEEIVPISATELVFFKKTVHNKDVTTEKRTFELRLEKRLDSILIYICIHAKRKISTQTQKI